MSRIQYRGSIALGAVLVALLSTRAVDAQVSIDPRAPREPGGLVNNIITGVQYDIVNQRLAERRLQFLQAKLRHDAERGNAAAVERDKRRIDNVMTRIRMDEWLIRWNSLEYPCFYPLPIRTDPATCSVIAQMTQPTESHFPTQDVAPPTLTPGPSSTYPTTTTMSPTPTPITITIDNSGPPGVSIDFAIDGVAQQFAGGSHKELTVPPDSIITYDGGGKIGQRRYQITAGKYEFRSTPDGWDLYKLDSTP